MTHATGLGIYRMDDTQVAAAVDTALQAGYRLFDTAAVYGNEQALGRALARAGAAEVTVVSKVWIDAYASAEAMSSAVAASVERLGRDRVDVLLLHWPASRLGRHVAAWESLVSARELGLAGAIGVSNFLPRHLDDLASAGLPAPQIHQIERHPWHAQDALRRDALRRGASVMAWSPLGRGRAADAAVVARIAAAHAATPAQVALRWNTQRGVTVIPKSTTPSRIRENIAAEALTLTPPELDALDRIDAGESIDPTLYERFQ